MEPFCSPEEGSRHALTPRQGPPPPEEDSGQAVAARANGTTWRHGAEHIPPPRAHGHCWDHGALDPGDTRSGTSRTRTCLSQYAFISLLSGVCLLILNWTTEPSCPATFRLMWSFSVFTPSCKTRKTGSQRWVSNNTRLWLIAGLFVKSFRATQFLEFSSNPVTRVTVLLSQRIYF